MDLIHKIKTLSEQHFPETVNVRRHLHANPELAFEEYQTAALVSEKLHGLGIPHTCGVAKTGVVGLIEGSRPGKTIALRADMDALPILEENNVPYCSTVSGKMHACGHDAHTASLLTTAAILQQLRPYFSGTIKLVFQPSEEKIPGGASVMITEGVLQNPEVQTIIGQHVMPQLPCGKVGIRPGRYMASVDDFTMVIHGQGGHGAQPHQTIDPVTIAAQVIISLQQLVSRMADPRIPTVLTVGKVIANGATNIIPNSVYLEGTFRTFNESWRAEAHKKLEKLAHNVVEGFGGRLEFEFQRGYPVLENDERLTESLRPFIEDYVGPENVVDLDIWMASEDFAFYTRHIPGCFYRIGTRNEARGIIDGLHTPTFDIEEQALSFAPGLMAWLALKQLQS